MVCITEKFSCVLGVCLLMNRHGECWHVDTKKQWASMKADSQSLYKYGRYSALISLRVISRYRYIFTHSWVVESYRQDLDKTRILV